MTRGENERGVEMKEIKKTQETTSDENEWNSSRIQFRFVTSLFYYHRRILRGIKCALFFSRISTVQATSRLRSNLS